MITYQRLWETMKKRGITQYHLIKREKFSAGQIGRLKNNQTVSTQTLDTLCRLLSCRIEDIVTYIPDNGETLPEQNPAVESIPDGGEHLPDPEPDQTSPVPSKKVTKSEKPDKSDKTEKSDKKNKKKSKKKNKDKDKKQGD